MKEAEIRLHVNQSGETVITIRHHDKDNSLIQNLIGGFIKEGQEKGIEIVGINGTLCSSKDISFENYEIRVKD